ncbi:MAG: ATP-binding protein, partial [Deltaproteobacteria bacterium]|nr:ATP-binding protein [Deltaproteobacteria bacterium]
MKLSAKYATTLIALTFCVVLAFAGVIFFQFRSEIEALNYRSATALGNSVLKEIEAQKILSTQVLAAALTNPLYQVDMLKIGELVEAVKKQPNVHYVFIYDEKRRIVHDGTSGLLLYGNVLDDALTIESVRSATAQTLLEEDLLHVSTPVKLHDQVVGGIKIGFSLTKILSDIAREQGMLDTNYRNAAKHQLYVIGIIALIFSLCAWAVSILVARSWSNPIVYLAELTAKIGKGQYDVTIPIARSDEIGDLASAFREMVRSLKSLRQRESEQSTALVQANAQLHLANDTLKNEIIQRQHAQHEVSRQHHRLRSLYEIGAAINGTLDQTTMLQALFGEIEMLRPHWGVSVCLLDVRTKQLNATAARHLEGELWRADEWDGGSPALALNKLVVEQKTPLVIDNLQLDSRSGLFEPWIKFGWTRLAGLPLMAEGEVLGALMFYARDQHSFSEDEVQFLVTLAGQLASAILNSRFYEESLEHAADLLKANKAKDEFLNVMSHELRTPLNVISGYAQVLSEGMLGEANHEQKQAAEKIINHSGDLLRMINEILQVGGLQAGNVQAHVENVDLNDIIKKLQSTFDALPKKGVLLHWDVSRELPIVKTDGDKLTHVLQNLLHNAIKFTDEGGVTLSARRVGKYVEFKVKDTGIGIPREMLPVIFEMFRQVDSTKTRCHSGVGVGLFIVNKFSEILNGSIEVESMPGFGTTF